GSGRGTDRRVLSRGVEHRGVRHHGPGSHGAPCRPVRQRGLKTHATYQRYSPGTPKQSMSRFTRPTYAIRLVLPMAATLMGIYPLFLMMLLCFALFACAFNLLLGFTGLLSFGHAAFFGSAAYVSGHVIKTYSLTPEWGLLAGTLGAGLIGLVVGLVAIRRQGIYFAMITLAIAQMVYFLCLQLPQTGGEDGLQGVPRGELFGFISLASDTTMYYL